MKENSDSTMPSSELLFTLEVKIPDQSPIKIAVRDRILAGIDPRNDLILVDRLVKTKQFLFEKRNDILTVHYLGNNGDSFLNTLPLEKDKVYILESGDVLRVGKIEIMVRRETISSKTNISPPPSKKTPSPLPKMKDFLEEDHSTASKETPVKPKIKKASKKPNPIPAQKNESNNQRSFFTLKNINLIPYKFYGFVIDVSLTYFVLSFALAHFGVLKQVQDFFYPFSEFISQFLIAHYPEFPTTRSLSLIEFFLYFHCLMISSALILGRTPGALLVGIHPKIKRNFLTVRFKAYIYALINIAALPLLIFDIPFYRGKNIKEILTFSEKELSTSSIFRFSRHVIAPIFIMASFLSLFFLSPPYTANITMEKLSKPKYMDTHTLPISSSSREFGFSLKTDLNQNFAILPYFEKKKLGLMLYDFKTKKQLLMKENGRLSTNESLYKLRYANPLASFLIPEELIENAYIKNKVLQSFDLAFTNLIPSFEKFGPFMANGFLFKNEFLKNFSTNDNFIYIPFEGTNPAIKISASGKSGDEEKVFLFARKSIIEFSLTIPTQTKLLEVFTNSLLAPLRFDQSSNDGLKDPQILEVLSAFERSNYQTLLTYYIKEAKKAQELHDLEWLALLKANLEQTKRALVEDTERVGLTKNIEKSFDDIINTL